MQARGEDHLSSLREGLLYCPQKDVEDRRRAAVEIDAKIKCIEDILNLDYEDLIDE